MLTLIIAILAIAVLYIAGAGYTVMRTQGSISWTWPVYWLKKLIDQT